MATEPRSVQEMVERVERLEELVSTLSQTVAVHTGALDNAVRIIRQLQQFPPYPRPGIQQELDPETWVPAHDSLHGLFPKFPTLPLSGKWAIQGNSTVTTLTDLGGGVLGGTVLFDTPFTDSVVTVVATNGDYSANAAIIRIDAWDNQGFEIRATNGSAGNVRVNWIALGS